MKIHHHIVPFLSTANFTFNLYSYNYIFGEPRHALRILMYSISLFLGFLESLFPDFWEFPFSHHFFFRYVGLFVAFAYHGFLCTSVKLYIMCVMLLLAVFPYAWLEMKLDVRSRKSLVSTSWHR